MTTQKPIELDYFPTRNGGPDQSHTHLSFRPSAEQRESCGACAQLENDFTWLRFNDAMADRASEFGTVAEALAYAAENIVAQAGRKPQVLREAKAGSYRDRVATAA